MTPPIPPKTRAAILADIHAGQLSRNRIAEQHGVAPSTVTAIAKAEGLTGAFDRSSTKNATEALRADSKQRRALLSRRLLDRAAEALEQMDQPHIVFKIGGSENIYTEHEMNRPPTGDMRNLMIIAATAIDKHIVIERHDSDQLQLSEFDRWLAEMMGKAGAAGAAGEDDD